MTAPLKERSAAGPATDGARRKHPNDRKPSAAARRRQAAAKAPPALSPDDRNALRRLAAAAQHVLHVALEDTPGRKELLRAALNVAEQATVWHRRIEPGLYARDAGGQP